MHVLSRNSSHEKDSVSIPDTGREFKDVTCAEYSSLKRTAAGGSEPCGNVITGPDFTDAPRHVFRRCANHLVKRTDTGSRTRTKFPGTNFSFSFVEIVFARFPERSGDVLATHAARLGAHSHRLKALRCKRLLGGIPFSSCVQGKWRRQRSSLSNFPCLQIISRAGTPVQK